MTSRTGQTYSQITRLCRRCKTFKSVTGGTFKNRRFKCAACIAAAQRVKS